VTTDKVAAGIANNGTNGRIDLSTQTWVVGDYAGDFMVVNTGTGAGQAARILWNTVATASVGTLYLDRQLVTALDATSDVVIYRPFSVALTGAATGDICVGVSVGTLTGANSYGWMQVAGFCPMVLSEAAIAANAYISASATAGKAIAAAGGVGDGGIGFAVTAAAGATEIFGAVLQRLV
jgi:hypothetical protein